MHGSRVLDRPHRHFRLGTGRGHAGSGLRDTAAERLADSASVLRQIMASPDQGIPVPLLAKARCVVIVPGLKKAGFIVGGTYGRGFITCRRPLI